ncbi:MAG TPA: hypothetical protein VGN48_00180 [Pedococcus sp.]|nr:hypothetical protein [Pedococcus sp.]
MDAENPHAGQGPVLLDIGDDVGALVVLAPATLAGHEIEIRARSTLLAPEELPPPRHVSVLPRAGVGGTLYAAVFSAIPAGDYELALRPAGPVQLVLSVLGSQVTEATWPT